MNRRRYLQALVAAMRDIAERRSLVGLATTHRGQIGAIEGVAHELAHQLEAGRNFERRLREMNDREADEHEASTLRIETAALAALGVRVSIRSLWRDANWREDRPTPTKARRVLDERERRCVAALVAIVQRARGSTEAPARGPT
jgi:predicted nicotinamide N-methyase